MLHFCIMSSLSGNGRAAVNTSRTEFNLAQLKIVPFIKNLFCRCFVMIERCDAVKNYLFLRDPELVEVVGL